MNEDKILSEIEQTLSSLDNAMLPSSCDLNIDDIDALLDRPGRHRAGFARSFGQPAAIILVLTVLLNILTLYALLSLNSSTNRHKQLLTELKSELKIEQSQNLY